MATTYPALFDWYSIVITWSILFIVAVSIYLYLQSRKSRKGQRRSFIRDFAVVALGNVIVEVYVVYYILRNKVAP